MRRYIERKGQENAPVNQPSSVRVSSDQVLLNSLDQLGSTQLGLPSSRRNIFGIKRNMLINLGKRGIFFLDLRVV
jgi:hypothetical protein